MCLLIFFDFKCRLWNHFSVLTQGFENGDKGSGCVLLVDINDVFKNGLNKSSCLHALVLIFYIFYLIRSLLNLQGRST